MNRLACLLSLGLALAGISCSDAAFDPNSKMVNWRLNNCKDTGMNFCGNHVPQNVSTYEETCADAKASAITFTIVSHANGGTTTKTSGAMCPSGQTNGSAAVKLPDMTGPFDISATLDGVSGSTSARGCRLSAKDLEGFTLRIYYAGCGDPNCASCN